MPQRLALILVILSLGFLSRAGAQDPPERVRVFCDPTDPCNQCPGRFCACLDDTLEVTFDGDTASVLEYEAFHQDERIDTVIVTDTRSRGIQGWSYAVEHEASFLTLLEVTVDGTEAERAKEGGFALADMRDIEACLPEDPACTDPVPGVGYVSAVILSLAGAAELPLQRSRICAATYALASDPGPNGTLIQVVDRRLKTRGGPPVQLVFTVDSPAGARDGYPTRIIDGWLKRKGEGALESCDNQVDDDGDGRTDCEDWDCLGWPNCVPDDHDRGWTDCSPENCGNSQDDDGDGLTDCIDPNCRAFCRELCFNSQDDDEDGLADCIDPDCLGQDPCGPRVPEHEAACDNDWDDDQDGFFDCYDPDCADSPSCIGPEKCGNFRDEDRDGLVDCDDPDCAAAGDCLPGPERTRPFCDPSDPENRCAGEHQPWECKCAPDILQVTLGGETESVLEYEAFQEGARVDSSIVLDTRSVGLQGWTFAVEHDDSFLTLLGATMDGTDASEVFDGGFRQISTRLIEACEPDDPGCSHPVPGSGYVVGVVLGLTAPAELRLQRNSICRAEYALKADPGPDGTLVRLVDRRLKVKNSRPVSTTVMINGSSLAPATLIDGWVKAPGIAGGPGSQASFRRGNADRSGKVSVLDAIAIIRVLLQNAEPAFDCDDALDVTDDGRVDVIDSVRLLQFLLERGSDLPAPFPVCGPDPTTEPRDLACRESGCGGG